MTCNRHVLIHNNMYIFILGSGQIIDHHAHAPINPVQDGQSLWSGCGCGCLEWCGDVDYLLVRLGEKGMVTCGGWNEVDCVHGWQEPWPGVVWRVVRWWGRICSSYGSSEDARCDMTKKRIVQHISLQGKFLTTSDHLDPDNQLH